MTKKTKIALLVIWIISLGAIALAQKNVSVSLYQDLKLATMNDDHGNEPYTMDIVFKFKMQGNAQKFGYMYVAPYFEYAEIDGNYKRYAAEVGYVFNELIVDDFEASGGINYGIQERYSLNWLVFGADFELAYKITDRFKVSLLAQFVERKDLQMMYGNKEIRFSGFIGLTINLK